MSLLYDISNNPAPATVHVSVDSGGVVPASIRIDCKAGNFLRCETVADLAVEAKLSTDVSWTNLETTPIDLTPYDATRQTFDLRLTAASVAGFERQKFKITVRP